MNNRIQNNPGMQYLATRSLNDKTAPNGDALRAGSPAAGAPDRLSLSARADRLNQLIQQAHNAPDVNESRVEALKQAISSGQYQVNAEALAANMLGVESSLKPA